MYIHVYVFMLVVSFVLNVVDCTILNIQNISWTFQPSMIKIVTEKAGVVASWLLHRNRYVRHYYSEHYN